MGGDLRDDEGRLLATGEEREALAEEGETAYVDGAQSAEDLAATHPARLKLALSHSMFLHDTKNDIAKACKVAKKTFDGAHVDLDNLNKDATVIMQLLRDALTQWT